jgi:Tfp pilus assembly protein PilZ
MTTPKLGIGSFLSLNQRRLKRYTSRFFKSLALFYVSLPLAYILIVAVLFDVSATSCLRILLSPFYYFVGFVTVVAGYGLLEMRRWAWYWFIAANILIAYQTALIANDYAETHHQVFAYLAVLVGLVFTTIRVAKEVRVPYFFPRIPWWESDPRYRLSVPVTITFPRGEPIQGEILDLSLGGCFIKVRAEVYQDEIVLVEFTVLGQKLQLTGAVVWRTQSTVTHPKGVGVKFTEMDRRHRRSLRGITRKLRRATALSRKQRYLMNQEEFLKRLEKSEPKDE